MSASVADDMIRSYFDRWQRLEEEKRTISDDLKEMFAEARGNGLDTKALRAVFREQVGDKAALQEFDAICDLYRASLNAPRAGRARESQSYAEGETGITVSESTTPKASNSKASNAETGDLGTTPTDTQEQPETADEFQAKVSEDNGSITGGAGAVAGETSRLASGRTDAGEAASADLPTNPPSDAASSDAVADTQAPQSATATLTAMTAKSKADIIRLLRPHCRHADDTEKCGSPGGARHCHACQLLADAEKVPA